MVDKAGLMIKGLFLLPILLYKGLISPFLSPHCRFYPTCSEYAYESILTHGVIKGLYLAVKRLLKCHPFHQGGFDAVPKPDSKNRIAG